MKSCDQRVLEIAAQVQDILAKCGKCHVIRNGTSSGYVHTVSFRKIARDLEDRFVILMLDTTRLPRGVHADELREMALLQKVERLLGYPVRLLDGPGVSYAIRLTKQPVRVPATSLQTA